MCSLYGTTYTTKEAFSLPGWKLSPLDQETPAHLIIVTPKDAVQELTDTEDPVQYLEPSNGILRRRRSYLRRRPGKPLKVAAQKSVNGSSL